MGFGYPDHKERTETRENPLGTFARHYHMKPGKEIADIPVALMKEWHQDFVAQLTDYRLNGMGGLRRL
jgi:hypothetical protein